MEKINGEKNVYMNNRLNFVTCVVETHHVLLVGAQDPFLRVRWRWYALVAWVGAWIKNAPAAQGLAQQVQQAQGRQGRQVQVQQREHPPPCHGPP